MPRMGIPKSRPEKRARRHLRVRKRVAGTETRPRLVVFRSLKHIYAQIVDDSVGRTLMTVSDLAVGDGRKMDRSVAVGRMIAAKAKDAGITQVVFDRAGYKYHGRVKAVANAAREGGLEF